MHYEAVLKPHYHRQATECVVGYILRCLVGHQELEQHPAEPFCRQVPPVGCLVVQQLSLFSNKGDYLEDSAVLS